MKESIYNLAEVTRGLAVSPNEINPKNKEGLTESYILGYPNLISYKDNPSLSNTIDFNNIEECEKVYIDFDKKYKQGFIQKNDIILPISNMDYEPKFVNWNNKDLKVNFIYHHKLIVIRPYKDLVIPEYLFFILNSKEVRNYWFENSKENGKHRLICKKVQDFKVNIPSMKEQKEYIDKLKELNVERQKIYDYFSKSMSD